MHRASLGEVVEGGATTTIGTFFSLTGQSASSYDVFVDGIVVSLGLSADEPVAGMVIMFAVARAAAAVISSLQSEQRGLILEMNDEWMIIIMNKLMFSSRMLILLWCRRTSSRKAWFSDT